MENCVDKMEVYGKRTVGRLTLTEELVLKEGFSDSSVEDLLPALVLSVSVVL